MWAWTGLVMGCEAEADRAGRGRGAGQGGVRGPPHFSLESLCSPALSTGTWARVSTGFESRSPVWGWTQSWSPRWVWRMNE